MSEDELVSNSYVLIIAGSETTATLLSGVTFYILTVPGVMDKLKAEIRGAFAAEAEITWSAVNQLPYTLAVLNEGLRMYPPVPFGFPRMVEGLGDFVCGRWIPGGVSQRPHSLNCSVLTRISNNQCYRHLLGYLF